MLFDIDDDKKEEASSNLLKHRVVIKTEHGGEESTKTQIFSLTWLDGVLDDCLGQHEVGSDLKNSSSVYIKPERKDGDIKIEEEENLRKLNLRITQCSKRGSLSNILIILDDEESTGLNDLTEESANNPINNNLIDYDKYFFDVWRTVNDQELSLILQSNKEATCGVKRLRGKAHLILTNINCNFIEFKC